MKLSFLCIAILCFKFNSFSQVTTNFTKQDYSKHFNQKSVPSDIKKSGHILIVSTPFTEKQEKSNEEIKKIFETLYKGKFILAPTGSKILTDKIYQDKSIYKYMIVALPSIEKKIHLHYKIAIVDRVAFEKDPSDFTYTNLEDDDLKLNAMLAFYAEKLGQASE